MKQLALVLFAWLAQAVPFAADAQPAPTRCNPAMQCCRQANLPGDPGCAGGGNPINLLTGNKYQQETDLAPLPGVQGLEIVRRYNSASALDTHVNRTNGLLGKAWRLSYEIELSADGEHQRILTLADGSQVSFTRGVLQPTHFIASDLGQGRLVEQGDGAEWQRLDGQRFSFNGQGRLVQIHAATGEFTSLAHDGQGRPIKVTDPQGRSLQLHYADAKSATRYRGVSAIDTPVGRFEYRYGSGEQAANLVQVLLPGQAQRRYHYEDPRHASALTGVSIDDVAKRQRLSTYLYDAQGLAVLSVKGIPAKLQTDANGQSVQPHRLQDGSGLEQVIVERGKDSVTVLNSLNQASQAKWAGIAGQRLITEFRGAGCAHCPPPNTRWAYDQHGRLTETTQLGAQGRALQGERHELDAWGRVKATHRVSYANGQAQTELVARFEYAAPFADMSGDATQPTLIARPSVVPGKEHVTRIAYNAHGQPTSIAEEGFSPIDDKGELSAMSITRTTSYQYSGINGRSVLKQIDGPLANGPKASPADSDLTTMQWDERGSVVTTLLQPGGFKSEVSYDEAGRLQQVRNHEGASTRYHYTAAGQLAKLERSINGGALQTQTFEYDTQGRLVETGADSGNAHKAQTRMAYDGADRLLWRANALGWAEQWKRDSEGRIFEEGRFSSRIVQSSAYEWNADGSLKAVSDNAGRRVVLSTPSVRRDVVSTPVRADPSTSSGQGTPDGVSKPTRTSHLVDDFGRVVLTRSPDSGSTMRQFDAADRLTAMRDALNQEAHYAYDAAGRVTRQTAQAKGQEPVVTQWRYEGRKLVELIHPTQSERYAYDAQGQRTTRSVTLGGHTALTRHERDANGELTATTLPDGSRITCERNGQDQITSMTRSNVHTEWLRGFERKQLLAKDFERDLVGLASYTAGNGIEAKFIRSREGTLARVLYRQPQPKPMTARNGVPEFVGKSTQDTFERLLGIAPAHAAGEGGVSPISVRPEVSKGQAEPVEASSNKLPGALGQPQDPQALIDHRYLWDPRGNLMLDQQRAGQQPSDSGYAYDWQNRLIVASTQASQSAALQPVSQKTDAAPQASYYLHDAQGRRVLARDEQQATRRIAYDGSTHRWSDDADVKAEYDASGQPQRIGTRRFEWDVHGRLLQVRDNDKLLATYQYSHRGQRIEKKAQAQHTLYLYDEQSQLTAELDASGKITRQYVYAANLPIAVIEGEAALHQDTAAWLQAFIDIGHIARSWIGAQDNTAWLHTNHLGAPEAATDAKGQLIWKASYAASGKAKTNSSNTFALNLRLPGQYADAETGLHYNLHRYYDPERGQYLSPDPLAQAPGYPDGPNPYAYVRYNPLRYVDPQGLVLFAFDGTGNDLSDEGAISNVARFRRLYQGGGEARYVAGVGTVHNDRQWGDIEPPGPDMGTNGSGTRRIERMMTYLMEEARTADDYTPMDIDIVGFSRGAAQARDFANNILGYFGTSANGDSFSFSTDTRGWFNYSAAVRNAAGERVEFRGRQCVRFRFMGLWDTVLSANTGRGYNMAIPAQFQHVAHAVALNEHRSDDSEWNATRRNLPLSGAAAVLPVGAHWGGFPLVSIGASSNTPGRVRIERGFVGAHADIGGGYAGGENQLSFVALSWMVAQARSAGVQMRAPDADSTIPTSNPIIHDQSNAMRVGSPVDSQGNAQRFVVRNGRALNTYTVEDRQVSGAASGSRQRNMGFTNFGPNNRSMTFADTQRLISYLGRDLNGADNSAQTWIDRGPRQINGGTNQTGTVNIAEYMRWLRSNGYCFAGDACDRVRQ
jgi:RHS repeat-associated protein